ncbi:hypothetical protein SM39_0536 [Serratia marcescens SM39]|uniref:Uncharacterized protein n=1 Tax=Serratia marcescens SM39 TaxID=1334564 RepID=A0AAT9ESE9_SERMA|nr:hypothetical protein SM39_0536 [Serratia marcescens SM39]
MVGAGVLPVQLKIFSPEGCGFLLGSKVKASEARHHPGTHHDTFVSSSLPRSPGLFFHINKRTDWGALTHVNFYREDML